MHYRDLGKAVGLDKGFSEYPKKPLTVNLEERYEKALRSKTPDDVAAFLKEWNRRVRIDPNKLRQAIVNSKPMLEQLRGLNIVSVDFNGSIDVDGRVKPLCDIIANLFEIFSVVSEGRRNYTGASKILHVLAPTLFVMWDDTIRCAYGCRIKKEEGAGEKYFKFLNRVQKEARQAVNSYCSEHKCGAKESIERIREELYQGGFHTIARLVDEFNYQK